MRIMAIDYGDARTGIAVSDAGGLMAGYTEVVPSWNEDKAIQELQRVIRARQPEELVLGLPRNMDGTEGPRAEICRGLAARLEQETGLPVHLWDERLTTVEAHQILHASGKKMKAHRQNVDAVAASLILEGYLQYRRRNPGSNGAQG